MPRRIAQERRVCRNHHQQQRPNRDTKDDKRGATFLVAVMHNACHPVGDHSDSPPRPPRTNATKVKAIRPPSVSLSLSLSQRQYLLTCGKSTCAEFDS